MRRKTNNIFSKKPLKKPQGINDALTAPVKTSVQLRTFADLFATASNLNPANTDCSLVEQKKTNTGVASTCVATTTTTTTSQDTALSVMPVRTVQEVEDAHRVSANQNPWEAQMMLERLSILPVPSLYLLDLSAATSRQEMEAALRRRQLELPFMPSWFETELLQEAGVFTHPSLPSGETVRFPPCALGGKCVGMTLIRRFPGASPTEVGFVLTAVLFRDEYTELLKHRKQPSSSRPCVLCCRKTLCDWVLFLRHSPLLASESPTGVVFQDDHSNVYQIYRNAVDTEDGYCRQSVLFPHQKEAIIDPIPLLQIGSLQLVRSTTPGARRRIDQSTIVFKTPPVARPKIGEKESTFCSGAGQC